MKKPTSNLFAWSLALVCAGSAAAVADDGSNPALAELPVVDGIAPSSFESDPASPGDNNKKPIASPWREWSFWK